MSNRVKHMERSHKTYSSNYSVFAGFKARAMKIASTKAIRKDAKVPFVEKIMKLFKRPQSR